MPSNPSPSVKQSQSEFRAAKLRAQRYLGNDEATIKELLADPIAELLRHRDQLTWTM
jgi:hypothetical protein